MESSLHRSQLLKDSLYNLRNICQTMGISKVGNKPAIVDRIMHQLSTPEGRQAAQKDPYLAKTLASSSNCVSLKNLQCFCSKFSSNIVTCTRCKRTQHRECVGSNLKMAPYVCAACQLSLQNPLEEVKQELIKPFLVCVASQTLPMRFNCDMSFEKSRYEVQVRCVKLDETGFVAHWPKWGYITVNGRNVYEIKSASNPNAKKRKDAPLDIGQFINKGENSLAVTKNNDTDSFVCGLYLVEKKSERALIQQFLTAEHVSREKALAMITLKLGGEEEVKSESLKLSLRCPFSKTLLRYPVRGSSCDHPQCFSLEPFVQMQKMSKVNRWKCPICKKLALSLVIDDFFTEIMGEAELFTEPEFVEIFRNGTYRMVDYEGEPAVRAAKRVREDDAPPPQPTKRPKTETAMPRPTPPVAHRVTPQVPSQLTEKRVDFVGSLDWPISLD
mmetsp:Transcript_3772/g.8040  ORF Transcript_3772/g.8040 Transcript_3772/m.8040 type:complete len:443 (+) Transcript_3772:745-2073(+)